MASAKASVPPDRRAIVREHAVTFGAAARLYGPATLTMLPKALACLRALVFALSCTAMALGAPTEADRATARSLANEGYRALRNKDYQVAEDRFRRADALVHAPSLVVDHARAFLGLGRLVEAHEQYELVLREGIAPGAPAAWHRALADAQRELKTLRPRLAWLTIVVKGANAPRVVANGRLVPPAALGVRRATDPGEVHVSSTSEGYSPAERTVILAEGEERSLELEMVGPPVSTTKPVPPAATPLAQPRSVPPTVRHSRDRTRELVACGVSGVALAGALATGILFLEERSELNRSCRNGWCPPEQADSVHRYQTLGYVSAASLGVSLAGAALGIAFATSGRTPESPERTRSATVQPYIGGTTAGVEGRF